MSDDVTPYTYEVLLPGDGENKRKAKSRERDLAWEALVRETAANPAAERGVLNAALKAIREAAYSEGLTEDGLPEEIRLRANAWRDKWPHLTLTPMGLAKHWFRVMVQPQQAAPSTEIYDAVKRLADDG